MQELHRCVKEFHNSVQVLHNFLDLQIIMIQLCSYKMSNMKFILNDENKVNQFGFRVLNSGIDLTRLQANPVILDMHTNNTQTVIGRWKNIQIEGHLLIAEAEFDMEDEYAAKIAGKVERGFLKGVSLGLNPLSSDNFQIQPDSTYALVKCEAMEASIVALPNNANALKLYAVSEGVEKIMETSEIQLMLSNKPTQIKLKNKNMIKLTANALIALGMNADRSEIPADKLSEAILQLKANYDTEKAKVTAFEQKEKETQLQLSAQMVDSAIKEGKIDATQRQTFIDLAARDFELAQSTLGAIPAKVDLAALIVPQGSGAVEVKTLDDFQKLDLAAQLDFKNNSPQEYQKLFK